MKFALGLLVSLALWLATSAIPVRAQVETQPSQEEAMHFVQNLADGALETLSVHEISNDQLQSQFRSLLEDGFEMERIGLLALGRFRATATAEEIEEYLVHFEEFILQKYSELLSDYAGETFVAVSARASGKKDMVVTAEIRSDGITYLTSWRVRNFDGTPKIIDIKVEGISMVQSQREEFAAILRRGGMTALINELKSATSSSAVSSRA